MKKLLLFVLGFGLYTGVAHAAATIAPTLDLEKKIAYQQGQFGALYAHCASAEEQKAVLGGSLANWRSETFAGYHGNDQERAALLASFDEASQAVNTDTNACRNWLQQASATMRSVSVLSRYGFVPVK